MLAVTFRRFTSGLLCCALGLSWAPPSAADIAAGGGVDADTTWKAADGPVRLGSDVVVRRGATLTIEAGSVVYMADGTSLVVEAGSLKALGSAARPIRVTSARAETGTGVPGDWRQWSFQPGAVSCELRNVAFEYGRGLAVHGAAPVLESLDIRHQAGAAITLDLAASPVGSGNRAAGNDINAILVPAGEVTGSTVWGLRGIPYLVGTGSLSVGNAPRLDGVTPNQVQQGRSVEALLIGGRLAGIGGFTADGGAVTVSPRGALTQDGLPVTIAAAREAPLGPVGLRVSTDAGEAYLAGAIAVLPYLPDLAVSSISPASLRRGESRSFTLSGTALAGAGVASRIPQLTVAGVASTATTLSFTLAAALDAPLGAQMLTVTNPAGATGSVDVQVVVNKALPLIQVSPSPIVVPLDKQAHGLKLVLSDVAESDYSFDLAVADGAVAAISPTRVSIAAGGREAAFNLTPKAIGKTGMSVAATGLAGITAPIQVTPDYLALQTKFMSPLVGVMMESSTPDALLPRASAAVGVLLEAPGSAVPLPALSPVVGVIVESGVVGISPLPAASQTLGVILESGAAGNSPLPLSAPALGVVLDAQ